MQKCILINVVEWSYEFFSLLLFHLKLNSRRLWSERNKIYGGKFVPKQIHFIDAGDWENVDDDDNDNDRTKMDPFNFQDSVHKQSN